MLLSRRGTKELVGIDFSSNSLKLAHVKRKNVVKVLKRDINNLDANGISKNIRECFDQLKVKDADIISVIPSRMVITKNIEIPSTNYQEIKEIINLQASRYTPYSREEITVDYIDIATYKNSYTKILLVIVSRDVIKKHYEILERANIRLENVVFMPESLSILLPKMLKLDTQTLPVSIVHVDDSYSDFVVIFRNRPVFVRSLPIGAQQLMQDVPEEKESCQLRFRQELARSLEGYQSEDIGGTPNKVVLIGATEGLKNLESVLNDSLHIPVEVMSYFEKMDISRKIMEDLSKAKEISFLNVLSSLFTWGETKVNLIPQEVKLKKVIEERGKDLIKTGVFVLTSFVLIFFIFVSKIYFKTSYFEALDTKYQSISQEAQKLEDDFARVSLVRNYLSKRVYSLEVLTELYDVVPDDVALNDINFDESKAKFSIKGTAGSMSRVFSFVDNMERSSYFKDVKTRYTTKRKDGLKDVTDFEINSILAKESN